MQGFFTKYCDLNVHRQAWLWKRYLIPFSYFLAWAELPVLPQRHHHATPRAQTAPRTCVFSPSFRVEIPHHASGYRNGDGQAETLAKMLARSPSMIVEVTTISCESGGSEHNRASATLPSSVLSASCGNRIFLSLGTPLDQVRVPEAPRFPRLGEAASTGNHNGGNAVTE